MNTVPLVGVLLLFALAVVGSAWYLAFRLRTTFRLRPAIEAETFVMII